MKHLLMLSLAIMLGAGLIHPSAGNSREIKKSSGQTVYLPVYSHIYSGDREKPFLLAVTISIRNTDPNTGITITSVNYHDTEGTLIERFLDRPHTLTRLNTLRYVIRESDTRGGSGAKCIIIWKAARPVTEPVIEAVMIGTGSQQGISFTSRGTIISE